MQVTHSFHFANKRVFVSILFSRGLCQAWIVHVKLYRISIGQFEGKILSDSCKTGDVLSISNIYSQIDLFDSLNNCTQVTWFSLIIDKLEVYQLLVQFYHTVQTNLANPLNVFSEWVGVCQPNLLFITIKQYDIVHELTSCESHVLIVLLNKIALTKERIVVYLKLQEPYKSTVHSQFVIRGSC